VGARVLVDWIAIGVVAGELLVSGGRAGANAVLPLAGPLAIACAVATVVPRWRCVAIALAAAAVGSVLAARAAALPDDAEHVARLVLPIRTRVVGTIVGAPVELG